MQACRYAKFEYLGFAKIPSFFLSHEVSPIPKTFTCHREGNVVVCVVYLFVQDYAKAAGLLNLVGRYSVGQGRIH